MISILFYNFIAVLSMMILAWILSLVKKDASLADSFWGLGFVLIAWITFSLTDGYTTRRLILTALTTIWGVRLAVHITWRNWGKEEDRRYQNWRSKYGEDFWWISLFTVFGLQASLLWLISLVLQVGQLSPQPAKLTWLDWIGIGLWFVGFAFEAAADWQLAKFKADPANHGKVMDRGLWSYSRHPNYFGEALIWWGIYLITLATPGSLWAVISPLTITYLLLKVSGVTLLEKSIIETKPEYSDYIKKTSAFVPWFPKRGEP